MSLSTEVNDFDQQHYSTNPGIVRRCGSEKSKKSSHKTSTHSSESFSRQLLAVDDCRDCAPCDTIKEDGTKLMILEDKFLDVIDGHLKYEDFFPAQMKNELDIGSDTDLEKVAGSRQLAYLTGRTCLNTSFANEDDTHAYNKCNQKEIDISLSLVARQLRNPREERERFDSIYVQKEYTNNSSDCIYIKTELDPEGMRKFVSEEESRAFEDIPDENKEMNVVPSNLFCDITGNSQKENNGKVCNNNKDLFNSTEGLELASAADLQNDLSTIAKSKIFSGDYEKHSREFNEPFMIEPDARIASEGLQVKAKDVEGLFTSLLSKPQSPEGGSDIYAMCRMRQTTSLLEQVAEALSKLQAERETPDCMYSRKHYEYPDESNVEELDTELSFLWTKSWKRNDKRREENTTVKCDREAFETFQVKRKYGSAFDTDVLKQENKAFFKARTRLYSSFELEEFRQGCEESTNRSTLTDLDCVHRAVEMGSIVDETLYKPVCFEGLDPKHEMCSNEPQIY